jgi:hypothetical protein
MSDAPDSPLAPLVGLPVAAPRREANMLALRFGEGAGALALEVYCAWRLARGAELLAGSADLFTPADPDEDLETFDYEAPHSTWWDARVAAWAAASPGARVTAASVDALGGVQLAFDDGAVLEVFPNSAPAEHVETDFWRLEGPGGVAGHGTAGPVR